MKEKNILLIAILSLAIAFVALAFRESYLADPANHDWWSLSFVSQEPTDASFSVSNFGATKTFFYEVSLDDTIIESASFTVSGANGQTIIIQNPDKKSARVNIWTEGEINKGSKDLTKRKEIYKR
jgi:hypothetical protein